MKKLCLLFLVFAFVDASAQKDSIRLVLPIGHTAGVNWVVFSPDGKTIVTTSDDHSAKIWDVVSGKLLADLKGHDESVTEAVISSDGKLLLTFSHDGNAKIWEMLSGLLVADLKGHKYKINSGYFSQDGLNVLTSSNDGTAKIWQAKSGKLVADLKGHTDKVISALYSPDEKKIVTASWDGKAIIWDAIKGESLFELKKHTDVVNSACFSPDGKMILTSSDDNTSIIWDAHNGRLLFKLTGHKRGVFSAKFSSDGSTVLTASDDKTAKIWSVINGKMLHDFKDHTETVYQADFSPDGGKVLTVSLDNTAKIYDSGNGQLMGDLAGHTERIYLARFSSDSKKVVTASWDKTARIWDANSGRLLANLKSHSDRLESVTFSADCRKVVTASKDNTAKIWDATSGELLANLSGNTHAFYSAAFFPDGKRYITLSENGTLHLWDATIAKLLLSLKNTHARLSAYHISLKGNIAITGFEDGRVNIWDLNNGLLLNSIKRFSKVTSVNISPDEKMLIAGFSYSQYPDIRQIFSPKSLPGYSIGANGINTTEYVQYSPDNKKVIVASSSGKAWIWDVASGKLSSELVGGSPLKSAKFSPDGKKILTFSNALFDDSLKLWNASNGQLLFNLAGHSSFIQSSEFSKDGKRIVSSSYDNTARIWDSENGRLLKILKGHNKSVEYACFSPDKKNVITCSADNTARVWDSENGQLLYILQGHTNTVKSACYSPGGDRVLTTSLDNSAKIWDTRNGKLIYTFFPVDSVDYFTLLPNGYYQTDPNASKLLHYVTKDLKIITFEQLDVKYNRPDKVLTVLGNAFGSPDTALINSYYRAWQKRVKKLAVDTTSFQEGFSVPESDFKNRDNITYEQTSTDGKLQLKVWGIDSTYKLDRFNVWVNEVPVFGQRGINIRSDSLNTIERTVTINLSEGENRIETSLLNVNGIESYRVPLYVRYTPKESPKEKLYFVGIGINKFAENGHNLNYSVKDIHDLTAKLKEKYKGDIEIDTLFDENVTREKVLALKKHLQQSGVNDKVIIAYSGHGLLSKDYDYYLSTYGVKFTQPQQGGLPYEDLEWLLDSIPARKKLMLIDACHSGELDKEEITSINKIVDSINHQETAMNGKKDKGMTVVNYGNKTIGLKNSFELMQELFANVGRGTGATILSAAAGTQFAIEDNKQQNGYFTYSILELMKQKENVKVSEVKSYVGKRVEELSKGMQKPTSRNETIDNDWRVW